MRRDGQDEGNGANAPCLMRFICNLFHTVCFPFSATTSAKFRINILRIFGVWELKHADMHIDI